jgi:alkylhydroperoxidase/carboxymuconolactone decarboxylase family protein YurZ
MAENQDSGSGATAEEVEQLLREQAQKRGYSFTEFAWLARKDPEFEKARVNYSAMVYTRQNPALPVKYREIIASIVLSFRGYPSVESHLRRALREGATMQEIIEAFEVATVPGGMPVLHFALPYLIKIDQEQ